MAETVTRELSKVITNELSDFLSFISKANVIQVGVGLLIANQISILFNSIIQDLFAPIISKLIGNNLQKYNLNIAGMQLGIGNLILTVINFIMTLLFIYYMVKYLPKSAYESTTKK